MILLGAASELGRQMSTDNKSPGGALTIAEEAVDQLQENEKLVAGWYTYILFKAGHTTYMYKYSLS